LLEKLLVDKLLLDLGASTNMIFYSCFEYKRVGNEDQIGS